MDESGAIRQPSRAARRRFRSPSLTLAAAEFQAQNARVVQGRIGCLAVLTGALLAAVLLLYGFGVRAVVTGLAWLLPGVALLRGASFRGTHRVAVGIGGVVAAVTSLSAVAGWSFYWAFGGLLFLAGLSLTTILYKGLPFFLYAREETARICEIGFFRPFHAAYASEAKNLLLPLLQSYGHTYFVGDASFDESEFSGAWSRDYAAHRERFSGHRYTNAEWQKRVLAEIKSLDVAVVDVSILSANLIWEIRQCWQELPAHRIIFVACIEAVFPQGLPATARPEDAQQALSKHIAPIAQSLKDLVSEPGHIVRFLTYSRTPAGQRWLANELFQTMMRMITTEEDPQLADSIHLPLPVFNAANAERVRRIVQYGSKGPRFLIRLWLELFARFSVRTRLELMQIVEELARKHHNRPTRAEVALAVPVCRDCRTGPHPLYGASSLCYEVTTKGWKADLMTCGLSDAEVDAIEGWLKNSEAYVFCHGACHRALVYGRDDVYVTVAPFQDYFVELLGNLDDDTKRSARKWVKHLVFVTYLGRCSSCRTPLVWPFDQTTTGVLHLAAAPESDDNEPITPVLLCANCENVSASPASQSERVILYSPLMPDMRSSW